MSNKYKILFNDNLICPVCNTEIDKHIAREYSMYYLVDSTPYNKKQEYLICPNCHNRSDVGYPIKL